jgi:hypothetical protein
MNLKKETLLKFNKNLKVLLSLHKHMKEKCILVHEGHVHNVKPWKTFTWVQYKILRRVVLELPFSTGLNVFFKVKCWFLSSFSLRDIYLLKISVVSTCEIAKDVMFHKLPLFIIKQKFLPFVPRNIALQESQVTRFTSPDVRGHEKF